MPAGSGTSRPKKKTSDPRDTPAMRQYARFKAQHPDCVLFFRMGDFYEMFDDDARLCHQALGITLTERTAGVPMAGVPHHAMENYLRRMIEQGYRVAVCEQIQDPKDAKGVVERAVTRVVTPGTLVDESLLDEGRANMIVAVQFIESGDSSSAVAAAAELSTGSFTLHELPAARVLDELSRLGASELLFVETADGRTPPRIERLASACGAAVTPRPAWTFRLRDAGDCLRDHFGVATMRGFGLEDDEASLGAAGALLRYLQETQSPDQTGDRSRLAHLRPPRRRAVDDHMLIDATSLRSLEIDRTMRTGQLQGSLLHTLQSCRTAMGKRLLRSWLCFPLRDVDAINERQAAVATLLEDRRLRDGLAESLKSVQDVARIAGRIAMGRALPRDLAAVGRSLQGLPVLLDLLSNTPALASIRSRLAGLAGPLGVLSDRITMSCVDDPPAHLREGGLFRDGVDSELDEARSLQTDANQWLAEYQAALVVETDIPSLKVGYNKVFGYYIEITHVHRAKTPDTFTRKQTLKNAERYITPELKTFEDKVTTAQARAIEREKVLFEDLCRAAAAEGEGLATFADEVAGLDVLLCFADAATRFGYVRPTMTDDKTLEIVQGRHPVLDRTLGEKFVPNDCRLAKTDDDGEAVGALALITGPNMAGKSTFIRQAALITLLAHTGSFVPADAATIGLTDRIFTRIGASDELHTGQSTFMVEMTETANILHHATDRSLVILDEIGRGTSTLDGLALAWAIAETLADVGARTLFATHYHELTTLADERPEVTNLHVTAREWRDEIVFVYRVLPGRTDRSYGIHVARIAGAPSATIDRANELLETLSVQHGQSPTGSASARTPDRGSAQMSLFTEYVDHPVVTSLRDLDLERMSPLEAFDALRRLRDEAQGDDRA